MKKSVLFLINGYAIEQKGSYSLYNESLAPNLDMLIKDYMYTTLDNTSLNYIDGYREFSIGSSGSLNFNFIKKEASSGALDNDNELLGIKAKLNNPDSKLHVFYFVDDEKKLDCLRDFFTSLKDLKVKEIYAHLICTKTEMKDYKDVKGVINKFGYGYVPKVRVASVVGANYINDEAKQETIDDYVTSLFYGYSELWRESDQKISHLMTANILPADIKTFCINSRYEIGENDNILFFNYTKGNYSRFLKTLLEIPEKIRRRYEKIPYHVYSLFPTGVAEVPSAFQDRISDVCLDNYLKKIYTKAAIIDEKSRLNAINNCAAGLKNIVCENIDYFDSSNGILYNSVLLSEIINNSKYGFVILNYNLDRFNSTKEMREEMTKIDNIVMSVYRLCMDNGYTMFISALYGIKRKLLDGYGNEIFLNLSERVPLVILDNALIKQRRKLTLYPYGRVYDLAKTIYKTINNSYEIDSLIREKQSLFSVLFKKKK